MVASSLAIEARWLRIDGHPQAHWLLCDARRQVLAEFHCLAREAPGASWQAPPRPVPPKAMRLVHLVQAAAGFDATVPGMPAPARRDYGGSEVLQRIEADEASTRARWTRAACALPLINRALEESNDDACVDSQSALATLAQWMGLEAPPPWPGRPDGAAPRLPPIRGLGDTTAAPPAAAHDRIEDTPQDPAYPDPVREHPLYRQARNAVARMEDGIGRDYDATSERLARSLVELAETHGLAGIDHVVLSRKGPRSRAGENVFVIRGRLDDPAQQRVVMKTDDALARDDAPEG